MILAELHVQLRLAFEPSKIITIGKTMAFQEKSATRKLSAPQLAVPLRHDQLLGQHLSVLFKRLYEYEDCTDRALHGYGKRRDYFKSDQKKLGCTHKFWILNL